MKILAISDVPSKALWDYGTREHLEGIDLILSCGDLPQKYLEYLTNFTAAPILYVHGNHDGSYRENEPGGCICVDDSVYVWKGLRIMGLGGSIRYNNREDSFQYTEREMRRRVRKLWRKAHHVGGIDLLLTHSPAAGLNDSTDHAHKGFACFNDLMDEYEPQWFVHGHVHLNYDAKLPRVCTRGKTTVINATERFGMDLCKTLGLARPQRKERWCSNMKKSTFSPVPSMADFILVNDYTLFNSAIYRFMNDLRKLFFPSGTEEQNSNLVFLLMDVYFLGRVQGIREERHNRRTKGAHRNADCT